MGIWGRKMSRAWAWVLGTENKILVWNRKTEQILHSGKIGVQNSALERYLNTTGVSLCLRYVHVQDKEGFS